MLGVNLGELLAARVVSVKIKRKISFFASILLSFFGKKEQKHYKIIYEMTAVEQAAFIRIVKISKLIGKKDFENRFILYVEL